MTARALFTGHAHSHVVCFRPLFEYLRARGDVHVFVSGGLPVSEEGRPRTRLDAPDPVGLRLDPRAMARPFYIPRERVVTVEEMAAMDVDLLFATDSRMLRPRSARCPVQLFPGLSFKSEAMLSSADAFFLVGPTQRRRLAS